MANKMKSTKNHKKEDGGFHSKKIKHDPQVKVQDSVYVSEILTALTRRLTGIKISKIYAQLRLMPFYITDLIIKMEQLFSYRNRNGFII